MTTKAKILASIEALKLQLIGCSCDDESPVFNPERNDAFFKIVQDSSDGTFKSEDSVNNNGRVTKAYRSRQGADNHAQAFNVLHALRTQEGVQPAKHGTWQYMIEAKTDRYSGLRLEVRKRRDHSVKLSRAFSPTFETQAQAQAAISAVGADAILSAMKTLAWVE